jgi:hypothetical protein
MISDVCANSSFNIPIDVSLNGEHVGTMPMKFPSGTGAIAFFYKFPIPGDISDGCYTLEVKWSQTLYHKGGTGNVIAEIDGDDIKIPVSVGNGSCSPLITNGSCGPINGQCTALKPSSNLCGSGTASTVAGSGPWSWSCAGSTGGTTAYCTAPLSSGGACGSAKGIATTSRPNIRNLCSAGTASDVTVAGDGSWTWTCASTCVGAICSAPLNASCGTANKKSTTTKPNSGLCTTGTASTVAVAGDGSWTWTCGGSTGGTNASCSAPLSGVCGTANGGTYSSAPTSNLCLFGSPSTVSGSGPWTWNCIGSTGGTSASCITGLPINGTCGPAGKSQ